MVTTLDGIPSTGRLDRALPWLSLASSAIALWLVIQRCYLNNS